MENFIFYLLKSGIWITVFWFIYWLFLRKEIFFKFNRYFLLLGLPASFALAFCRYTYPVNIYLTAVQTPENVSVSPVQAESTVGWPLIAVGIYGLGALFLLIRHLNGLKKILHLIRKQKTRFNTKPPVIDASGIQSSFSFFGYVFMNKEIELSEVEKRLILEHEKAHVEQLHWIDLLLFQIVCTLQWFNPFVWLYGSAIKQNHEFLADRSVIEKGNSQAVYHATLINYTFKAPIFALTNSFAYYNKFKRITMMKKNVSNPAKKSAVFVLIPALALFLWAFAKPEYTVSVQSKPKEVAVNDTITIVPEKDSGKVGLTVRSSTKTKKSSVRISTDKQGNTSPLIIVDDKEYTGNLNEIDPKEIESISVLKGETASVIYGEDKKNGAVVVVTKKQQELGGKSTSINTLIMKSQSDNKVDTIRTKTPVITWAGDQKLLVFVDGKEFSEGLDKLDVKRIESMTVLKDKTTADSYGEKGKNGVIIITLKE
jgi:TonB-dependent SusC/RagA subfamily outer membrane receptor